jgi:hypothetical protein
VARGESRAEGLLVTTQNRYSAIIGRIFRFKFRPGMRELDFERGDIEKFARQLRVPLPKNLGDLIYSFRFRAALPESIQRSAPRGFVWAIRLAGRAKYRFVLLAEIALAPNPALAGVKVPDATPGIIARYALGDEQALLARVRYNRLVDVFTGLACYSLQNHLRTTAAEVGQVETDELYVGLDKRGVQYVLPVQAKGGKDKLSVVQVEQDLAVCSEKFPRLICRPIGAQFMHGEVIALFEFQQSEGEIKIAAERHYRLVPPEEITQEDLETYRRITAKS